jgi:hypothetical protein
MAKTFSKYAGVIQLVIGLLGQFIPGISSMLGAHTGGNVFNLLSGAALSYFGFKGTESAQRTGAQAIGGLNGLVGLLNLLNINIPGISLSEGTLSWIVNLAIGAWGLYSGFAKKPAGATAH